MESKHIRRDFNANVQHKRHYGEDYWLLEIHKQKQDTVQTYLADQVKSNGVIKKFNAWDGVYAKSGNNLTLSFSYEAKEEGDYRIDCLYGTTDSVEMLAEPMNNAIFIDGVKVKNDHDWMVYKQYNSRNCKTVHLKKGKHTIEYHFSKTIFVGAIVRQIETYKGDNLNGEFLTIKSFDFKQANDLSVDEFECNIQYWHRLDDETNISGYLFDFSDEVTFKIKAPNGKMTNLFGGYISTVTVDEDLKLMTLHCSGRLRDLEHRYTYPEYVLLDGDSDVLQYRLGDSFYNLETYTQVLEHLLTHSEVSIGSNLIDMGRIKGTTYSKSPYLKFYGSNKNKVLVKKNVEVTEYDNCIMLRNSPKTNVTQSVKLFDSGNKAYDLNKNPTFFIQYGMGVEKYEGITENKVDTSTYKVGTTTISSNVSSQAKRIVPRVSSSLQTIKDLHRWNYSHIKWENVSGFYQGTTTTLRRGRANCCCKAELLLEMAYSLGIIDGNNVKAYFVHEKNNSTMAGHVYCRFIINGTRYTVDPTTHNFGSIASFCKLNHTKVVKVTAFPKRPF